MSSRGRPQLMMNHYKYSCRSEYDNSVKKYINSDQDTVEFITSKKGNPLLKLSGYTYYEDKNKKTTATKSLEKSMRSRWRCSTHQGRRGCRANVVLVGEELNDLLMYKGHTFSKVPTSKNRYQCSQKYRGCKADVRVIGPREIRVTVGEHGHPPPIYTVTKDGRYVKI
ncbi:hypothetical protein JYU34_004395 [Plutella xylostella]|uniref:FLYWCH-type domain-containing protein n=1 Tax=Plutella xylostella TaxID=51655 RepID=A0ABQ7QXW8_PLUXY|nr:hypothetical protein JYU34_004395 [Plutella xylostella]